MLGNCSTRTHRSAFAVPVEVASPTTLIEAAAGPVAIDPSGRVYATIDPAPTESAFTTRAIVAIERAGEEVWRFEVEGFLVGAPILSGDGTILSVGIIDWSDGRALVELSSRGELLGAYPVPERTWSDPAVGEDGSLYFAASGTDQDPTASVFAMRRDRSVAWTFTTVGPFVSRLAVAPEGRVVFGVERELIALEDDGAEIFRRPLPDHIASGPAIADDGAIYVTTHAHEGTGALVALEADGTTRFEVGLRGRPRFDDTLAVAHDGAAVVATEEGLAVVDARGDLRWERAWEDDGSVPASVYDCAIDARGLILVAHEDLVALRPEDGTEVWRVAPTTPGPGTACFDAVTIGDDRVYGGACDRRLLQLLPP